MGVGICNKNTIRENNFSFLYDKIDKHGTFLLMANGLTWSAIEKYYRVKTVNIYIFRLFQLGRDVKLFMLK
jgi:hypothetical protein